MTAQADEDVANKDQATYWSSDSGQKWVRFQETLDTILGAANGRLYELLDLREGHNVLDIGCGTGVTVIELAGLVGTGGKVTGVDISAPLLDRAQERAAELRLDHAEFIKADAQTHSFALDSYDRLASRFGVMFFENPVSAFQNLRSAMSKGGRLAFVSWAPIAGNPWFEFPRDAAVSVVGKPPPTDPRAPGPLAFAEHGYVLQILADAGWSECTINSEHVDLHHGGTASDVATFASQVGPATRIVKEMGGTPEHMAEITQKTAAAFAPFEGKDGVRVPAQLNFVTAVNR